VDLSGSDYRPVAGFCEHGNEFSGSIKFCEFPECSSIDIAGAGY
jgi:hypothetical protein